ncbi:hypothetical protein INN71_15885 [Nocardioides sp. ChNu-153]|uniref:hypothetical protein n=1 Tax=unclassified Nocardioides TaxID=2615069 RepID=UPI002405BDDA|nr:MULTISPECIES: hypothetical protein [unclassified Nocardioides]MDF9716362.1 hypothetical protein [Nocardioides sp. ChNu-99]MDN7122868.1 hypothetical protein [Nocardioides sp. ChNu-153]
MDAIALHVLLVEQVTRAVDELVRPVATARSRFVDLCVEGALACDVVGDDAEVSAEPDVARRSRWATSVLTGLAEPGLDAGTRDQLARACEVAVGRFCTLARGRA